MVHFGRALERALRHCRGREGASLRVEVNLAVAGLQRREGLTNYACNVGKEGRAPSQRPQRCMLREARAAGGHAGAGACTVRPAHRCRIPLCVHRDVEAMLWAGEAIVYVVASHGDAPFIAILEDGARKLDADAHLLTGLRGLGGRRCRRWNVCLSLQALAYSYRRKRLRCRRESCGPLH